MDRNRKSCVEEVEGLIVKAKKGCYTIDKYLIEFSRLIAIFIDDIRGVGKEDGSIFIDEEKVKKSFQDAIKRDILKTYKEE